MYVTGMPIWSMYSLYCVGIYVCVSMYIPACGSEEADLWKVLGDSGIWLALDPY